MTGPSLLDRIREYNECSFDGCANQRIEGMTRCEAHLYRWTPAASVEREPEWLRRSRTLPHGLARPLDRSVA